MAERPEQHILSAFAADTNRVMARRVPLGVGFFVGVVAIAGLIELAYYPARRAALAASFAAEMALCGAALLASRSPRLRTRLVPIITTLTLGIPLCITAYVAWTNASGDALALVLIIFLTGVALLFPWGAWGQVPLAVGTVALYLVARVIGVRGALPAPYGVFAVLGGGLTSVVGSIFLDLHRRAIFHHRVLLERTRDEQMAILYDVTRTVTATLDVHQVLRLVCQSVLHALGLERLWLFWREAPDGDVSGLAATRAETQVEVSELAGEAAGWEVLLQVGGTRSPALRAPSAEEAQALGNERPLPARLLCLPLEFRSELVGVILADAASDRVGFLDLAATLGNSAAMAIANARLHALLLHHRGELQRLSSKGLAVVEDIMRRISRELHDNTCQALMAIKLDLTLLGRQLDGEDGGARAALQAIRAEVVQVMQGIRQMSHLIYPPVLDDFGAVAAIESVAAKYQEASGLQVRVVCSEPVMRFAPVVELVLFRVFQEALTNVVKHARASRVDVRLTHEDGAVRLEIADDGQGFDAHAYFRKPPVSAGLGLLGMRERVGHLAGTFRVASSPGAGTHLSVRVPAEPVIERPISKAV